MHDACTLHLQALSLRGHIRLILRLGNNIFTPYLASLIAVQGAKRTRFVRLQGLINPWQSQNTNSYVKWFMRNYHIYGTLLTFSLALFCNTWSAGFAFDDNFAVVGASSPNKVLVC